MCVTLFTTLSSLLLKVDGGCCCFVLVFWGEELCSDKVMKLLSCNNAERKKE